MLAAIVVKVGPKTDHEGPEREYNYSCILSLTSALDGGGQRHSPAALPPRKRHGTHCTGDWVNPQGCSGRVWKISLSPRFDGRTVHPGCGGSDGHITAAAHEWKIRLLTLMS